MGVLLVTGSSGLIGTALCKNLKEAGIAFREFDVLRGHREDTRNLLSVEAALNGITGVVHLAAVSRVVWAQQDPDKSRAVNVDATRQLVSLMTQSTLRPFLIFASSREVYGEPVSLPVHEDAPLRPMNVYARGKVAGEALALAAREVGLCSNVVRFSNVYGSVQDHADRVVPAFARAAAEGGGLRLDGPENQFDFTHVDDAAQGLFRLIEATMAGERLPPIHLLTGQGTSLKQLANLANQNAAAPLEVRVAPSRNYDVSRFYGDPCRARELLGWNAAIDVATGFARLTDSFRQSGALTV